MFTTSASSIPARIVGLGRSRPHNSHLHFAVTFRSFKYVHLGQFHGPESVHLLEADDLRAELVRVDCPEEFDRKDAAVLAFLAASFGGLFGLAFLFADVGVGADC